jgi:hypothetical protein
MAKQYEAIAWERRPNGARLFVPTRRHYRLPGAERTLCGVLIPLQIREPRPRRGLSPLSLSDMTATEIAAEPACVRCVAAGGAE